MKQLFALLLAIISGALGLFFGSTYYYFSPLYPQINHAVATVHPTKTHRISGTVHFKKMHEGVQVTASIKGLSEGNHGFHIHEFGDCSCDDATCAGDHFNPTHAKHGAPDEQHVHRGDLGNIVADKNGNAQYDAINHYIQLNGPHSIIGRSIIIHEKEDDLISQPTGNAGARLGCGVIGIGKK